MHRMKKRRRSKPRRPAPRAPEKPPLTRELSKGRKLRLLIVLLVAAAGVGIYGMRDLRGPRDSSQQQDTRVATAPDSSRKSAPAANAEGLSEQDAPAAETVDAPGKDARVPTTQGPSWKEIDDPATDGWNTEVFASQATKQLKTLGKLLAHPGEIDGAAGR